MPGVMHIEEKMSEIEEQNLVQYQLISSRRASMDSLMWQVPVLSLTAQAFLFSIALGADTSEFARLISATLSLLAATASIQLMSKHRSLEVRDSIWLEDFEKINKLSVLHSKPELANDGIFKRYIIGLSSFKVWIFTLALFGLAALVILIAPSSWFS
jgi:hypothetical protein